MVKNVHGKSEARITCENIGYIWVRGHYRDGKYVKPYCRSRRGVFDKTHAYLLSGGVR